MKCCRGWIALTRSVVAVHWPAIAVLVAGAVVWWHAHQPTPWPMPTWAHLAAITREDSWMMTIPACVAGFLASRPLVPTSLVGGRHVARHGLAVVAPTAAGVMVATALCYVLALLPLLFSVEAARAGLPSWANLVAVLSNVAVVCVTPLIGLAVGIWLPSPWAVVPVIGLGIGAMFWFTDLLEQLGAAEAAPRWDSLEPFLGREITTAATSLRFGLAIATAFTLILMASVLHDGLWAQRRRLAWLLGAVVLIVATITGLALRDVVVARDDVSARTYCHPIAGRKDYSRCGFEQTRASDVDRYWVLEQALRYIPEADQTYVLMAPSLARSDRGRQLADTSQAMIVEEGAYQSPRDLDYFTVAEQGLLAPLGYTKCQARKYAAGQSMEHVEARVSDDYHATAATLAALAVNRPDRARFPPFDGWSVDSLSSAIRAQWSELQDCTFTKLRKP